MRFLFLSGSFRDRSRSLAVLRYIESFFIGHVIETPKLDRLPFYSDDLNKQKPAVVSDFLSQVAVADAIVICTPEYNHSIPAVLKNAIDWASRPAFNSVLKGMPVSIITQADSPVGGARVQAHVKLVLDSTLSNVHLCHEMMITKVAEIFDQEMTLTDVSVRQRLARHCDDFIRWVIAKDC